MSTARHRPLALLLAALAALAAMTLPAPPASAASTGPVVGRASGRCLDVPGNNQTPLTKVIIYDCSGRVNQAWTGTAAGELRVYGGTRCLEVAAGNSATSGRAQINTCTGAANQRWQVATNGTVTATSSGLCLDVTGQGTANSTTVGLWTCNGQNNQKWTVTGIDTVPPTVPANPRVSGLTCSSATLTWDASTDNTAVAFYDVFHDGQLIETVSGATLSAGVTVVAGVPWGLYVNARDAAGNVSQASTTVPVTPPQCQLDTTPPTAPRALTGSASGATVTLRWTPATDDTGVRTYEILRAGTKVGVITGTATTAPATTFVDSGLAPTTSYAYVVLARDGQGNASTPSNTLTLLTGAACGDAVCSVTQIATDTDIPWGLVTLPDGTILYSRRDVFDIVHLNPTTGARTTVGTVPGVDHTDGEGGLLGLAISAGFATDHWLYLMHTTLIDNRIVRIKVENDRLDLSTEQVLLSGILRNKFHNGGRLRFGPDGKLYASTGDAQNGDNAQNTAGLNGKVLRLNPDGTVPKDNPFGNYVWSYGHRNPQGLAFDSQGRLWEQEFGNGVMDETNLVTRGGNYGWPACEGTSGTCSTPGFIAPKRTYPVADGSCSGIAIVRDVLYVACERGTRLYRERISGTNLTDVQVLFAGTYGRLRTVEPAPGNALWLSTSRQGDKDSIPNNSNEKIYRVVLGG